MANNRIAVGNVEILSLSDGALEFDLCNFFPNIPQVFMPAAGGRHRQVKIYLRSRAMAAVRRLPYS